MPIQTCQELAVRVGNAAALAIDFFAAGRSYAAMVNVSAIPGGGGHARQCGKKDNAGADPVTSSHYKLPPCGVWPFGFIRQESATMAARLHNLNAVCL